MLSKLVDGNFGIPAINDMQIVIVDKSTGEVTAASDPRVEGESRVLAFWRLACIKAINAIPAWTARLSLELEASATQMLESGNAEIFNSI